MRYNHQMVEAIETLNIGRQRNRRVRGQYRHWSRLFQFESGMLEKLTKLRNQTSVEIPSILPHLLANQIFNPRSRFLDNLSSLNSKYYFSGREIALASIINWGYNIKIGAHSRPQKSSYREAPKTKNRKLSKTESILKKLAAS